MNLPSLFIRRPVMTTLASLAIVVFGLAAYRDLPVSDLPNVDFPVIMVYATLPGASPATMASSVALPLEKQFSTISGLDQMTSTSTQGVTQVVLMFDLSRHIDDAAQDVQSAIAAAAYQLPQGMPSPPIYQKVNPADRPILYLGLSSKTLPLSVVDEYAETGLAQRLSRVMGVAQVQVYGAQKYAVRIELDPRILASLGIGIDQVAQAVQQANVDLPSGTLYGPHKEYSVQANGQLTDAAAYRPIVVAYRNGSPVRLGQLGRVLDSVQMDKVAGWVDGDRAVVLAVQRQPGTNTVAVVDAINKILPKFESALPASVKLSILYDKSQSIRASVNDVQFTLILAVFLVIMVIFLFLRNLSATIIPSLALPMAIIGTFAVMYLLGYSLDNLSLLGLILSVGFVVDDAIVMLENIVRHMEEGESVRDAAFNGSGEIGFTILSMTLSLVAVFIPILFMGGILGRLLHEFAVTIATAILVSGFVSLTLTPMLCSRFLRPPGSEQHGRFYKVIQRGFDATLEGYRRSLSWTLYHRRITLVASLVLIFVTFYLFGVVPKGFLPSEDNGQIVMFTQAQQGISFDSMKRHQLALASIVEHSGYFEHFFTSVGNIGPAGGMNTGILFGHLKPFGKRPPAEEVVQKLRPLAAQIPGLRTFMLIPPPIQVSGRFSSAMYQLTLQSLNTPALFKSAPILEQKMREMPELRDVSSDLQMKNPQVNVEINRDKAHVLGISADQIEQALNYAYGSSQISTIYASNDEYWVVMQVEPRFQDNPNTLKFLYVRSTSGKLVPLSTLARLTPSLGPLSINHTGQFPSVTISFNVAPGVSLGAAFAKVKKAAAQTLPADVSADFQGAAQAFVSSLSSLGLLLILAILVIYIVLGILYESFIHPITILSGLPAAGCGALLALLIFHMQLDLYSFVGVIMLVGLVKKNAIMMIDFALDAQRTENKSPIDAIYEGCLIRFRPIMMTTMSALTGVLPIAIGMGAGSESRRPLGVAVVGGLLFSQLLTLYITPVVFVYMDKFQNWVGSLGGRRRAQAAANGQGEGSRMAS